RFLDNSSSAIHIGHGCALPYLLPDADQRDETRLQSVHAVLYCSGLSVSRAGPFPEYHAGKRPWPQHRARSERAPVNSSKFVSTRPELQLEYWKAQLEVRLRWTRLYFAAALYSA